MTGLLCSCNDDSNGGVPTGVLYLNIDEDRTLLTKAESEVTNESLRVDIIKASGDTLKSYKDYLTEVKGEKLILPVGKYAVSVSSNHSDEAAWETPFYQGCDTVEVAAGVITAAKVVCKIANTKVKVGYGSGIKDKFLNYEATVSSSSGTLTYERDEHRAGYFTPEKLNIDLRLVNNAGNEFHLRRVLEEVEPQHVYTFKFHLSNEDEDDNDAGADFGIIVDKQVDSVFCNIFIKEEELNGKGMPYCELEGFNNGIYSYKDGATLPATGQVLFNCFIGVNSTLQSVVVKTASPDFASGLSVFDLCKPEDVSKVEAKGFPKLQEIPIGENNKYKKYTLDLASFIPQLTIQEEMPTEHVFAVEVTDKLNQVITSSFTIKRLPDVAAATYEPICWTSFALLRGAADEQGYFKLRINDAEPIDITDVKVDENGNVFALIVGLSPNVSYTYWVASKSDETIKGKEIPFVVESCSIIPNLGFDNWSSRSEKKMEKLVLLHLQMQKGQMFIGIQGISVYSPM